MIKKGAWEAGEGVYDTHYYRVEIKGADHVE